MKKLFFAVIIILQSSIVFSQSFNEDISIDLRYPIPVGDNFLSKGFGNGYMGVVDAGIDYSIFRISNIKIGILLNSSFLKPIDLDMRLMILSSKIKVDYTLSIHRLTIIPQFAIGYSNWRFRIPDIIFTDENGNVLSKQDYKQNANGLTYKCATKFSFKVSERIDLYAQVAYEYTRLEKPDNEMFYLKSDRSLQIIYPGVGVVYKFN